MRELVFDKWQTLWTRFKTENTNSFILENGLYQCACEQVLNADSMGILKSTTRTKQKG